MAFCPNCGANVDGAFCAKCGATVGAGAGGAVAGQAQAGGMTDNVVCALCYLATFVTGVIFLLIAPYNQNKLVRFHAFQAIFFGASIFVCSIVLMIVSMVLHVIPVLGAIISLLLGLAFWLGFLVCWIMLMYKAYNNEKWVLPVIGPLAEKQA
jgi:uncharacterized membrane protein